MLKRNWGPLATDVPRPHFHFVNEHDPDQAGSKAMRAVNKQLDARVVEICSPLIARVAQLERRCAVLEAGI